MTAARIAIPVPTSTDEDYNQRNWPVFAAAVAQAGGEAIEVPLNLSDAALQTMVNTCGGILLPGSLFDVDPALYGQARETPTADPDPDRERTDRLLIELAMQQGKPLLGVCFGAQMLNVALGGTLLQDLAGHAQPAEAEVHAVEVTAGSLLANLTEKAEGPLWVNSSHHQAVAKLADSLRLTAVSQLDGIIEGFEGDGFLVGVQWHPERTIGLSATSRALFARLITEAAQ